MSKRGSGNITHISSSAKFEEYKKEHHRFIVFYGAEWCGGCCDMKLFYERISRRYGERIDMVYVDVDKADLDFSMLPAFVTYYNGDSLNSLEGTDKEELKKLIKNLLKHQA